MLIKNRAQNYLAQSINFTNKNNLNLRTAEQQSDDSYRQIWDIYKSYSMIYNRYYKIWKFQI